MGYSALEALLDLDAIRRPRAAPGDEDEAGYDHAVRTKFEEDATAILGISLRAEPEAEEVAAAAAFPGSNSPHSAVGT